MFSQLAKDGAERAAAQAKPGKYPQLLFEKFQGGEEKALYQLYTLAKEGDPNARTVMGWMFDNGVGVEADHYKAAELFTLAAPKVELARYNLGVLTLAGRGAAASPQKAMEHFAKCKRIGEAFVHLAWYAVEQGRGNAALEFAEKAAALRHPAGMYLYARLLIEKGDGKQGAPIMRRAANANEREAVQAMAAIYNRGLGVEVDPGMAAGWWINDRVLNHGESLPDAERAIERFSISKADQGKATRFARKWLTNRTAAIAFDPKATLNFTDFRRG